MRQPDAQNERVRLYQSSAAVARTETFIDQKFGTLCRVGLACNTDKPSYQTIETHHATRERATQWRAKNSCAHIGLCHSQLAQ